MHRPHTIRLHIRPHSRNPVPSIVRHKGNLVTCWFHQEPESRWSCGTMRPDGFASCSATNTEVGHLTTKTILVQVSLRLYLNAKCRQAEEQGLLLVQLSSPDSSDVLPGYSFHECVPITGDKTDHAVQWTTRGTLPIGLPFRVLFQLQECELFSFKAAKPVTLT